jgi:transposase
MDIEKRRVYSKEFKLEVIRQIKQDDRNISEIAKELNIDPGQIYRWVREYKKYEGDSFTGHGKLPANEEEMKKLRKKLADKEEELEILKKAIAIFSKKKGPSTLL